jgi:hypothetical protein
MERDMKDFFIERFCIIKYFSCEKAFRSLENKRYWNISVFQKEG